jgi:hypothetical protein
VKRLIKQIKAPFLIAAIVVGVTFGSTQQSKAAFYDNYYTNYVYYINLYNSTGIAQYYYDGIGFYYYYLAGYNGDYFGYFYDSPGAKSTYYRGSTTNAIYQYNYYAYFGDYYIRL